MTEHFFAPCPRGLEAVLSSELHGLGASALGSTAGGVHFRGEFELCYRVNLESRLASRVLWRVAQCPYRNEQDIYQAVRDLDWREYFDVHRSMMVEVNARHSALRSLDFVTLRVKDAVCDRFRDACGARPSVDTRTPDIRISAYLDSQILTLYLDTSGASLFKRGYRAARSDAPLKENLAAGILQLTGWQSDEPLLDPMCGSGTFLVEAALMALNIAPGMKREFAFEKLSNFAATQWRATKQAAAERALPLLRLQIYGSDKYGKALELARANLSSAGLAAAVQLKQLDILEASAPAPAGVLVTNPPYGVRSGEQQALAEFYPQLGDVLKKKFAGWRAYVFSADSSLPKQIRLAASKRTPLYNGALECRLYEYKLQAGSVRGVLDR